MYDIGDVYPATVTIRDVNGTPTPATGMTFTFALPDGTTITPSPSNPTTGVYTYDLPITQRGLHRFRAAATTPAAAYNDAFTAVDTTWPAFVGLGEVKQHLNIPTTTTTDDEELRGFILSASAVVESIVGTVGRKTFTEKYSGLRQSALGLRRAPVITVTSVTENGITLTADVDYSLSDGGLLTRICAQWYPRQWRAGVNNIVVTYTAGRMEIPPNIVDATKELIRVNWRPQTGGNYSVFSGGRQDDMGQLSFNEQRPMGFFIPNTVMQRLTPQQIGPFLA